MDTVKDVLIRARALIEQGWVQGHYALAADGREVYPGNKEAVCWCMYGALNAADPKRSLKSEYVIDTLADHVPNGMIADFNDKPTTTVADVLAVFDKAIASCK